MSDAQDRRLDLLRAALGFLKLRANAPELTLLHRWLARFTELHDSWSGIGLVAVGMYRHGYRLLPQPPAGSTPPIEHEGRTLMGHGATGVADSYGLGYPMSVLADAVAKIKY